MDFIPLRLYFLIPNIRNKYGRLAELGTKVNCRAYELFYKDSPAYTTPDSSFEFDSNMEQELTQDLGV